MDITTATVLVPGGAGFVGSHVTAKLEASGIDVVPISKRDGVDFRNRDEVDVVFQEHAPDAVVNCAAYVGGIEWGYERPAELYQNNILMATNLLDAAHKHGVARFVNPISNCTYPDGLSGEFEESEWWDGPIHESVRAYGMARKASWVQSWAYKEQYGFKTANLVLPNMYGPGDHFDESRSHALGALVMKFVEADRKDKPTVTVWGTGTPVREWLYVKDGAEALIRGLTADVPVEPINIGVGKGISIMDMAELISEVVGYDGDIVLDESKPDGVHKKTLNNERMTEYLDWAPETDLRDGIEQTVAWYREHR